MAAAVVLTGCTGHDRAVLTELVPEPDGSWRYTAMADGAVHTLDAESEATRIAWLEEHFSDNGMCPAGYEITDRTELLVQRTLAGRAYRIHYRGRCLD